MRIVGIDYSITSPAICLFDGKRWALGNCQFHFMTDKKTLHETFKYKTTVDMTGVPSIPVMENYTDNLLRFERICDWAYGLIKDFNPEFVAIEGYSMGSAIGRAFDIAENTALLKYKFHQNGNPYLVYPPTVIKKYATGKGNASKIAMRDSFIEETGVNLNDVLGLKTQKPTNPVSDIIDAYYIAKLLYEDRDQLI
jgi:Holliday junction resolvasome RuvABC endonuclease subunit